MQRTHVRFSRARFTLSHGRIDANPPTHLIDDLAALCRSCSKTLCVIRMSAHTIQTSDDDSLCYTEYALALFRIQTQPY
jgi:hypothetical protein